MTTLSRFLPLTRTALAAAILSIMPSMLVAAPTPKWESRVVLSPIGGHVTGNPAAPTKVTEYVSYTCPHCAHFVKEASDPLRTDYVRGGNVSVEVRNAVRDRYDLTAALLARCGGPARFSGNHEALFANQDAWMEQIVAYDRDAKKPAEEQAALRDISQKTGLYTLMGKRGFTAAQLNACLASPMAMKQILAMTNEAWNKVKINGTPGFVVNGVLVKGSSWADLKAALPTAAH